MINQSINQSFICSEQHKKKSVYTIHCRTGHKGVKHLQVPQMIKSFFESIF